MQTDLDPYIHPSGREDVASGVPRVHFWSTGPVKKVEPEESRAAQKRVPSAGIQRIYARTSTSGAVELGWRRRKRCRFKVLPTIRA